MSPSYRLCETLIFLSSILFSTQVVGDFNGDTANIPLGPLFFPPTTKEFLGCFFFPPLILFFKC